jgi:type IV pilus assembly protein PilC
MFSPRIQLKPLAQLCQRLSTATGAGLQDVKIWQSEATRGSFVQRRQLEIICERIERGDSIAEAVAATGNFFPPLFRQMVAVGDETGNLDKVYRRLAQHYERSLTVKRNFLQQLSWPLFQLCMTIAIVGLLIWIMGLTAINADPNRPTTDLLGLGLTGTRGLVIYGCFLGVVAVAIALFVAAARRGAGWSKRVQISLLKVPGLGDALRTLAVARFTWSMQLVLDTSMDIRKALPLALDATGNAAFSRHGLQVVQNIESGGTILYTLSDTGEFPGDFLDHVAVGEESGRLAETMRHQSDEYQERASMAIATLAQIAGYTLWAGIAAIIIVLIFRIFSTYLGVLNEYTKM